MKKSNYKKRLDNMVALIERDIRIIEKAMESAGPELKQEYEFELAVLRQQLDRLSSPPRVIL